MEPAYLQGFTHFFYANLDSPINDSSFANWRLSIFDRFGNESASDIGTLMQDLDSGLNYRFSANFVIPNTVNATDGYQLVVYDTTNNSVQYVSNCIRVISNSDIENYTLLFFRNSVNTHNFNYEGFSEYNSVFLELNVVEQQPEIILDQYREVSTGVIRNQKTQTAKVVTLEAFFFDDEANDMMGVLSIHDDIEINGKTMTVKTAYEVDTNVINSIQKGTIELYDQSFSTINLST